MTRQSGDFYSNDYLRQGSPSATYVESFPRLQGSADNAIGASGVCHATAVALQAGDVVKTISFITGGTAANGPTAGFVALYSNAATPALLAQSADFTTTARAANTVFSATLATSQTITQAGIYYVSISFTVSTTVPTLRGITLGNAVVAGAVVTGAPILAQTHGSAVGGTAPATIASPTTVATPIYYILQP